MQGGDVVATEEAVWVRTTGDLAVAVDPTTDRVVRGSARRRAAAAWPSGAAPSG